MEAVESLETKHIGVVLEQEEEKLKLSVENISPFIPSEQVAGFFQRGSSSKGKNRGIGLAKLQKMVEKSGGKNYCTEYRKRRTELAADAGGFAF